MTRRMKLGDFCSFLNGGTPTKAVPAYFDGDIPWITGADITGPIVTRARSHITEEAIDESATNRVPKGTILLVTRTSVGKVGIAGVDLCFSQDITAVLPDPEKADTAFLVHFLRTKQPHFEDNARGATIKGITRQVVADLELPLPPLKDQKRIAALLDKADALRRKRQEALRLTDDFLRSTFLDLFGDPLTNTRQLPMKPLREFGEIVTGNTPPRSEPENFGSAVEWIKSDNINTPNYYLTSAEERLSPLGAAKARKVPANSILVTCIAGSPSCIGNVALTNREVAFNQQINAVVPAKDTDPFFLFTQFLVGKKKIQNASTNGMKGMVSKGTFSEIEFLAPPEAKQREFGDFFRHMEELHRKNEEAFTATETLFSALQQRAFSGEL